ncbi:MAG: hypothetical protein FRX48_09498 [Lasallia pustulata]|uniref:ORC6 first cyclin-like domain-containing protein n=1 Tax=Lasallia pustulata TaxID=136370 RepID=A0A5M8PC08_9LECA|nr:MAG: hypothetical protein FRX48_09498 [Lasallia pustulata]
MDRSIAQALSGLVPTLNELPPELLELAVSLLAQSRSHASSLKAEEEIARSYACANLACERLKQSLGLPKIQPRPPCPPKVYQNLYRYLDTALPAGTRRKGRAPKSVGSITTPTSSPSKARTPNKPQPQKSIASRRKGLFSVAASKVPPWVMPTIRRLCTTLGAPAAPPHVLAGVSSILTLPAPLQSETVVGIEPKKDKIPAMVTAVYILVITRLSGVETSADEYSRVRSAALQTLDSIEAGKAQRENVNGRDVDEWLREIRDREWTSLDWFENIGEGAGLELDGIGVANEASEDDLGSEQKKTPVKQTLKGMDKSKKTTLQAGLGTMMQDKVNYLSEERRLNYVTWKQDVLARIDALEQRQQMNLSPG